MAPLGLKRGSVITAMLCGLLSGCARQPGQTVVPGPDWWATAAKLPLKGKAVQPVTADAVYTIYSRNLFLGATPDQRFLDRLLLVSGVFNGFNSRHPERTFLELRTHDDGAFTYAVLDARAQPLMATLVPGQTIKLLCRGAGAVGGSPMLLGCQPPPASLSQSK